MASSKPRKKTARKKAPKVVHRTRKTVPVKPEDVSEDCLQIHTATWLKEAYPQLLAFHVANERKANVQHHVKLKAKGVLAGVADWLLFPDVEHKAAIELKVDDNEQTSEQVDFEIAWRECGGQYYLCRTLEEFQQIVNGVMLFR